VKRLRVALLNDYDVVVAGLAAMLMPYQNEIAVVDVSTGRPTRRSPLDVVLYDSYGRVLDMDRISETVKQENVKNVAVFTFQFAPSLIDDAVAAGVRGYLWKGLRTSQTHPLDAPDLSWPMRQRGLTVRESEALAMLVCGLSNREIARAMFVSIDTVKTHLANVYRKLDVRNRAEAVATALSDPEFARRSREFQISRRERARGIPEVSPR
jgi:DNA-binding NarL/FixJ family response regulator